MLLSARRGAEWLFRMNNPKGRFVHGLEPALPDVVLEGDNYLRQAGAAFALARAARVLGDDRYTARSTQAILALLDETVAGRPRSRSAARPRRRPSSTASARPGCSSSPSTSCPTRKATFSPQSEQLCNYIRKQARPDGSLACTDPGPDGKPTADETAINDYPGMALYGLMRSQAHRPAAWKIDWCARPSPTIGRGGEAHKSMEFVPWQTAACWEAYLRTEGAAVRRLRRSR